MVGLGKPELLLMWKSPPAREHGTKALTKQIKSVLMREVFTKIYNVY